MTRRERDGSNGTWETESTDTDRTERFGLRNADCLSPPAVPPGGDF